MADIAAIQGGRRRTASLKVDLTPMVDLGFLLISFFVFTTTLSEAKAVFVAMPDSGPPIHVAASGAVTLIVHEQGIYYYQGETPQNKSDVKTFAHSQKDELRTELLQLKQRLVRANGNDEKLMVIIKPGQDADMGMVVDMFDEMSICEVKRYGIAELNATEKLW